MKTIEVENLLNDELHLNNSFFHFAPKSAYDSIRMRGLVADIGKHSLGLEKNPKVFFSEGGINLLRVADTWIRWLIWHVAREMRFGINYERWDKEGEMEFRRDFGNGKVYTDDVIREAFDRFLNMTNNYEYYILDLKEGIDFSYDDIDEFKISFIRDNVLSFTPSFKEMYGPYSNFNNVNMDKWNMHTFVNKGVSKDKIYHVVSTKYGNDFNMLDLIMEIKNVYSCNPKYKNELNELKFLNSFLDSRDNVLKSPSLI